MSDKTGETAIYSIMTLGTDESTQIVSYKAYYKDLGR